MILAAGRGERMRPLTDSLPKPLLLAGGRPLIAWHLAKLARVGIRDVVINHAWLGDRIEAALGDGSAFGLHIRYSPEANALETAGGIAQALPLLVDDDRDNQPILTISADVFSDFDFGRASTIALQMDACQSSCWCVMVRNPAHHGGGDFRLDGGRLGLAVSSGAGAAPDGVRPVTSDVTSDATSDNRAGRGATADTLTYAGVGLFRPHLFRDIERGKKLALRPILDREIAAGRAAGERHDGLWSDIGTPQRLMEIDRLLAHRAGERADGE